MAWIVPIPPSPRHPKPRWQVRYQDGSHERSAGIYNGPKAPRPSASGSTGASRQPVALLRRARQDHVLQGVLPSPAASHRCISPATSKPACSAAWTVAPIDSAARWSAGCLNFQFRGGGRPVFCHGHRPVISSSSEKLRNVRISTMPPRTPTLVSVGVTATVRMISAATSSSRPSRIDRPSCCRYRRYTPPGSPACARVPAMAVAARAPTTITATPTPSIVLPTPSTTSLKVTSHRQP